MAQQTAVDWLYEVLQDYDIDIKSENSTISINKLNLKYLIEQAKIVERIQIQNTYLKACARVTPYGYYNDSAEQYYNETYNQ